MTPPASSVVEGIHGTPDLLVSGLHKVRDSVVASHPLEKSEANHAKIQDQMDMMALRSVQGLHAPLRLHMERRAVQQVGRLPFLPSSNLHAQVLQGTDIMMDFSDFLNTPDNRESLYMPHAVVERSLGLL